LPGEQKVSLSLLSSCFKAIALSAYACLLFFLYFPEHSGVPGELRGLEYLHKQYGTLPWARLFAPAIRMARDGFNVTTDLVYYMDAIRTGNAFLTDDPAWAVDFAPNGVRVKAGDTMTRRRYAATLAQIAAQGASAFYSGRIADATIRAVRARNGTMTHADLANYSIVTRTPLQLRYRGYTVTTSPAPASGAVVLSILNTMSGYADVASEANRNLTTHRFVEAMRFAYGQVWPLLRLRCLRHPSTPLIYFCHLRDWLCRDYLPLRPTHS
jgi:gamma-glutamyltranspeptidase/glutathione hydrolase